MSSYCNWPVLLETISCNWLGGHASVLEMDWYGKNRLRKTPLTNMTIHGEAVAAIQNVDNFTFAYAGPLLHAIGY